MIVFYGRRIDRLQIWVAEYFERREPSRLSEALLECGREVLVANTVW
jgi:hypothetical protein